MLRSACDPYIVCFTVSLQGHAVEIEQWKPL